MIQRFRHRGLQALYQDDSARGVRPDQVKRLRVLLARLDASVAPTDMDLPGARLHALKGSLSGYWSVSVSGNWRLIFRFDDQGNATDVDLIDYH